MKVSIIGAGNVGSALAERILTYNLADVVLLDIVEDLAKAKALDLVDASPLMNYKGRIIGTNDYTQTCNSEIIVIAAGLSRRPGMTREDLMQKNAEILKSILKNIKQSSPNAILIVVTNPLDLLTYLAYKETQYERGRIIGMAGNLDTARFKVLISQELSVSPDKIDTIVLGSHGDTMVPLVSKTLVDGRPLEDILSKEQIEKLVGRTKRRGGEIVTLLKSGSAYFSPSTACLELVKAIINDEKKVIACSCILNGEYGLKDCAIGVPAIIGKKGILEVLEWKLPDEEFEALRNSAKKVKEIIKKLNEV